MKIRNINPLVTNPPAIFSIYGKNFNLKKGVIEKISYECSAYESVDDRSLS